MSTTSPNTATAPSTWIDRRSDLFASFSVFLISLPITIGIAIASNAPPAAGILSAIVGTLFFGLFSSSQIALYGPAAGLSIFLATASGQLGGFAEISGATAMAGVFLIILSQIRAYQIIDLIPMSVIKGMACGIGLTLVFKMAPHLFGTDQDWIEGWLGLDVDDAGHSSDPLPAKEGNGISYAAIIISVVCLVLTWLGHRAQVTKHKLRHLPYAFGVVLAGAGISYLISRYFPALALNDSQMLHLNMSHLQFHWHGISASELWPTLRLALIITTVILLEGTINLRLIQKMDPTRRRVRPRREFFLLGIANFFLSWFGALPIMPILIRSTANLEFGAKSRLSAILQGLWLLLAILIAGWFEYVPIAAVASLLILIGLNLVDFQVIKDLYRRGVEQFLPFAITVLVILAVDLLWGILAGFAIGAIFTIRSTLSRTMVLVEDGGEYLLKFFKDVTFIHKSELKNNLLGIPEGRSVTIDGTGNIIVDSEIEDWLIDYQKDSELQGRKVTFTRSRLALSKLFKDK